MVGLGSFCFSFIFVIYSDYLVLMVIMIMKELMWLKGKHDMQLLNVNVNSMYTFN